VSSLASGLHDSILLSSDKTFSALGFYLTALVVFAILVTAAVTELILTRKQPPQPALGHYVNGFVMAYPWLAGFFAVVVGAMIAHFFVGLDQDHQLKNWILNGFSSLLATVGINIHM
jgi:hypothetical protein